MRNNIKVVSYACDGTETEWSVQKLIKQQASFQHTYRIKHPFADYDDIVITIPMINGQLLMMIQDSNHGLKTSRNNLHTGAKVLTLGGHVAMYLYNRMAAFEKGCPLYHHDVEKTDRQDDNAAIRTHSRSYIAFLEKYHREKLGQISYLFNNGELIDAYQNRKIPHIEHIKMVLRAKFFYQMWKKFLQTAGYAEDRHYVSHQFGDIIDILVDGLIGLVIIYRDHMDGEVYPLLPWLHSTEVCKHIFGECLKLIKDFTYLDFIYMIPRLMVLIRAAVNSGYTGDSKAHASGYTHTYFDSEDINIAALLRFPSDIEIEAAAKQAWEEADSLFTALGASPADFMQSQSSTPHLPSISSWFQPGQDPVLDGNSTLPQSDLDDGFFSEDEDKNENGDNNSDAAQLQALIDEEEQAHSRSNQVDDRMLELTTAAIAVEIDETNLAWVGQIVVRAQLMVYIFVRQNLGNVTDEEQSANIQEDCSRLTGALIAARLLSLNASTAEVSRPYDFGPSLYQDLDLSILVSIRRAHETRRAKKNVRTQVQDDSAV